MPHIVHQKLASVAKFCSRFGLPIALFGMLMAADLEGDVAFLDKYMLQIMNIGIILYAVGVLFYFVTIPIERNASNRALAILKDEGILDCVELVGAQKSLNAAGLTYLAAAAAWAATFIRLAALRKEKSKYIRYKRSGCNARFFSYIYCFPSGIPESRRTLRSVGTSIGFEMC